MKPPAPKPVSWLSQTNEVRTAQIAASTPLPPSRSTCAPASAVSGWAAAPPPPLPPIAAAARPPRHDSPPLAHPGSVGRTGAGTRPSCACEELVAGLELGYVENLAV